MEGNGNRQYWLFQARPERYDLAQEMQPGREETWIINRNYRRLRPGDFVYFWQTGENAALHGWGVIEDEPYRDSNAAPNQRRYLVRLRYEETFPSPIPRTRFQEHPDLATLSHLKRGAQGTTFSLDVGDVHNLNQLLREQGAGAPPDPEPGSDPALVPLDTLNRFKLSPSTQRVLDTARSTVKQLGSEDLPLTTSSLFFGLADLAQREGESYGAAAFLLGHLQQTTTVTVDDVKADYFSRHRGPQYKIAQSETIAAPQEVMTHYVYNTLEAAEEAAFRTIQEETIHVRHLLAALLTYTPDEEMPGVQARLEEVGIELPAVRRAYLTYARQNFASDDLEAWREVLLVSSPAGLRLPNYSPDRATGTDYLGIDDEVNAVALLVASRNATPPLSIGLFGDWGSGKTFFMNRLQDRIEQLTADARASGQLQKELPIYKRVVQIKFNAWHYVDGDLWASLVSHILDNLRVSPDEELTVVEKRQKHWFEKLQVEQEMQHKARAEQQRLHDEWQTARDEMTTLRTQQEEAAKELAQLSKENVLRAVVLNPQIRQQVLSTLAAVKLPENVAESQEAVRDLQTALAETRMVVERGNQVLTPLIYAPKEERRRRWVWLVIALIAIPLVSLAVGYLTSLLSEQISNVSSFFAGLATLIGAGAAWIRNQTKWVSDWLGKAERAEQLMHQAVEEEQSEVARQIVEKEQELARLQADYQAAQRKEEDVQRRMKEIEAELARTTASRLLANFIQDRAESDDYRRHLGLAALVQRDFRQLSRFIELQNQELETFTDLDAEEKDADVRINRIVLYVDDLDRCPPEFVVQVLQAVHLLLAFPLFVVVVGVDARWISRSLREHYQDLLQHDGHGNGVLGKLSYGREATPHDYLEKIFQIPLWLEPMDEQGSLKMLQGLLQPDLAKETPEGETGTATTDSVSTPAGDGDRDGHAEEPASPGGNGTTVTGDSPPPASRAPTTPRPAPAAPNLEALHIGDEELAFIEQLAPMLNRSPRSVKRFVNTYRLIKAGLSPDEFDGFLNGDGPDAPYAIVIFLLAIVTEMPTVSRPLFQTIMRGHQANAADPDEEEGHRLKWAVDELKTLSPEEAPDRVEMKHLEQWLEQRTAWNNASLAPLATWAPRVARYSFRIARL